MSNDFKTTRLRRRTLAWISRLAASIVLLTLVGSVTAAELEGLGKAKLQMSVEEFKAAYPKAEVLEKSLGAAVVSGPYVKRYVLWKHAVPGLAKPTDVEFRFWNDKLWVIIVYFGENDADAVLAMLNKQLGADGQGDGMSAAWTGEKTTTVMTGRERYYSIGDKELSDQARAALFQGIHPGGGHGSAPASGEGKAATTPSADPTGATGATPASNKTPSAG